MVHLRNRLDEITDRALEHAAEDHPDARVQPAPDPAAARPAPPPHLGGGLTPSLGPAPEKPVDLDQVRYRAKRDNQPPELGGADDLYRGLKAWEGPPEQPHVFLVG